VPRRSQLLSLFVAALFAVSAFGDEDRQIHVSPRLPTTITPIEFRYPTFCGAGLQSITRDGAVIRVRYSPGPCSPPFYEMSRVALPEKTLPPGQYRVDLIAVGSTPHPDTTVASALFTVRPAEPQPLRVRPSALFRGGRVRIERTDGSPICPEAGCGRVLIGGQEVLSVELDEGNIWVSTPSAPGVYDVTVVNGETQTAAKAALYVFNEHSLFDATQFERLLLPINFSGPGGHGSQWITEQVIANRRPWNIDTGYTELTLGMVWLNRSIEANAYYRNPDFGGPFGSALLLPRADADDVSVAIRIRDTSRVSEGFGTEIPAVREEDMGHNEPLTLLDVPLDSRYRAKLRVYAFLPDALTSGANVQVVARGGDVQPALHLVQLRRDCTACPEMPLYGELDLPAATLARVDVRIDGPDEALTWGFITVTNNETQQVTTVTPQQ
jgi:hypothetical protein